MGYMLQDYNNNLNTENGFLMLPMSLTFDSNTGEAFGEIQYRSCLINGVVQELDSINDFKNYCKDNIVTVKENVGDMVKSKFLIIEERNYPTETGKILSWEPNQNYSHRLYHNVSTGLTNISLDYKNMYL